MKLQTGLGSCFCCVWPCLSVLLNFPHSQRSASCGIEKENKTGVLAAQCFGLLERGTRGQTFGPMAFNFECSLAIFEAEVVELT